MPEYFNAVVLTLLMFSPLVLGFFLKKKKMLNDKVICCLIILSGVLLRLIYITYTPITVRQHDVESFFEGGGGHAGYIEYIYNNHALPDFDPRNEWQFYHPPLHHILCAVWMAVFNLFGVKPELGGADSLSFLTLIYSSVLCFFSYKIFDRLKLKSIGLYVATALVTFHPTLIILSGSINNDILSAMLSVMAIYYTVKWSQDRKMSDILKIAFSVGLGMFTKLSVGLIAPAIAAVFLIVFIENIKDFKKYIIQFAVFAAVCCPIGLFWSVSNFVRYGMPLNYVPKISEDSWQYIDVPPLKRLTDWSLYQFASPFTQWEGRGGAYDEFNPFIALLKNSMFDESTFFAQSITLQSFCTALFLVNILIIAFSLAAMIIFTVKNKEIKSEIKALLGLIFIVVFGNYVMFCINFPHICTQNTRYCVPLIVVGAVFVGMFINRAKESKSKFTVKSGKVLAVSVTLFACLSAFVYTSLLYYTISL